MPVARAILLLCLFTGLFSCKKGNTSLVPNTTIRKSITEVAGPYRLFANSGEITTPHTVSRFLEFDSSWFSFATGNFNTPDSIYIVDEHTAKFYEGSRSLEYLYTSLLRQMKFTTKDTALLYSFGDVYSKSLTYHAALFKPVIYSEFVSSSTAGFYSFGARIKKDFYMHKQNDQLKATWIILRVHKLATGSPTYYIQSKLDPDFYHFIGENDTVSLREYSVLYD